MGAKPHDASFQIKCKLTVSLDVEGEMHLLSFQPANQMELSGAASRPGEGSQRQGSLLRSGP